MADTFIFGDMPILGWALDEKQQIIELLNRVYPNFDYDARIAEYKTDTFETEILPLLQECGLKLNLGGATEKEKIILTDKPIGIFDFGLASQGLYRLQEYYSEEIATKYPDKFKSANLPLGIVPMDYVKNRQVAGKTEYFYEDQDGLFILTKQQKGTQAINDGKQGAKLAFATKTKKCFVTFKRNKGKVKYLELYSLFYFSSLEGKLQYAIRQMPILMLARYFESIGIKTRIYMTRFVVLNNYKKNVNFRINKEKNGIELPMYQKYYDLRGTDEDIKGKRLFIQPIIVKDFGEDLDESTAFAVSTDDSESIYRRIAKAAQHNEITPIDSTTDYEHMGQPDWEKDDYYVGFERYRNKYQEYVNKGVFKSKEVLPEAMIFFHDYVIKDKLKTFMGDLRKLFIKKLKKAFSETEALSYFEVNPFFSWWMRLSANKVKVRVDLVNSVEITKELEELRRDMMRLIEEGNEIIKNIKNQKIKDFLDDYKNSILYGYDMIDYNYQPSFRNFISSVQNEITIYAEGELYPSSEEYMEKMDDLDKRINEAMINMTY